MADLGGLFAAIKTPFIIILSFTNFYATYQFVMADNFAHKNLPPKESMSNDIQWNCGKSLRLSMQAHREICRKMCCKPNLQERRRIKAY